MTTFDRATYEPAEPGPTGLFLETSGLFPFFHPDTREHEAVRAFMRSVTAGELPYRPLITNTYVVDELATLLLSKGSQELAANALRKLAETESVTVRPEQPEYFEEARRQFLEYEDQQISFTDYYCGAQMGAEEIDHVLAFDTDYETLGLTVVPR